ncbi:MAG: hypothetical protein V3V01_15405 [Acidimicrobiales bacterium]
MLMKSIRLFESLGASAKVKSVASVDAVIEVVLDGSPALFAVELKERAPYPGEVPSMAPLLDCLAEVGAPLLLVPYVSESLGRVLSEAGWSWIDAEGNTDISERGIRIQRRVSTSPPAKKNGTELPTGAGSWSIIRSLISDGFAESATETASRAGVSQPRASQILAQLTETGFVKREARSRWIGNQDLLLDAFLDQYSGPGGSTSWFYSLGTPTVVVEKAALSGSPSHAPVAVSGDVAADRIAPWRTPTHATLYSAEPIDASKLGLVAAKGADDANVEIIIPADGSVFVESEETEKLLLVQPTQVIWDLLRLGGTDREEAAGRVREWLLSH